MHFDALLSHLWIAHNTEIGTSQRANLLSTVCLTIISAYYHPFESPSNSLSSTAIKRELYLHSYIVIAETFKWMWSIECIQAVDVGLLASPPWLIAG